MNAVGGTDFAGFVEWSRRVQADRPEVRSLAETRIARAFDSIRPKVEVPGNGPKVHRCDLARRWCELRRLSGVSDRALVCSGVRHALTILFASYAQAHHRVVLPGDVYPVYWAIAAKARLDVVRVETFPTVDLGVVFAAARRAHARHVLLPYPFKLHGRPWTPAEHEVALSWMGEDAGHRLLLDGVYSFGGSLPPELSELVATDQVVYLDSLSKGWLHEQVFGAAVLPERDVAERDAFRAASPPQADLQKADRLLFEHGAFPATLRAEVDRRRAELFFELRASGLSVNDATNGYLLALRGDPEEILERRKTVTIPLSVFGGTQPGWAIASALPAVLA